MKKKPIKFWKNRTETEKTWKKPSQNQKKSSQNWENRAKTRKTEPNQFEPVFALKKPKLVGLTRFQFNFGYFFLKKNFDLVIFF